MISEQIIHTFYTPGTPIYDMLIKHSTQVRDKALAILDHCDGSRPDIDRQLVIDGAMVHDIGIFLCDAPGILCQGKENYIRHGLLGAQLIREMKGRDMDDDYLESLARVCERHTGAGLSREDILSQGLPLPAQDFLPERPEEKLICLADKFFSKSGDMKEKPMERVLKSMMKFGNDSVSRFHALCAQFDVK